MQDVQEKFNPKNRRKRQVNLRLEEELYEFLLEYSKVNYKSVTAVIRELISDAKHKEDK